MYVVFIAISAAKIDLIYGLPQFGLGWFWKGSFGSLLSVDLECVLFVFWEKLQLDNFVSRLNDL